MPAFNKRTVEEAVAPPFKKFKQSPVKLSLPKLTPVNIIVRASLRVKEEGERTPAVVITLGAWKKTNEINEYLKDPEKNIEVDIKFLNYDRMNKILHPSAIQKYEKDIAEVASIYSKTPIEVTNILSHFQIPGRLYLSAMLYRFTHSHQARDFMTFMRTFHDTTDMENKYKSEVIASKIIEPHHEDFFDTFLEEIFSDVPKEKVVDEIDF